MPTLFRDLTGQKFGRLTAQWPAAKTTWGHIAWLCSCECGQLKVVQRNNLLRGDTTSCGCWHREAIAKRNYKHGHGNPRHPSSTYKSWVSMKERCSNPNTASYRWYGAHGITVCERWLDLEHGFENFLVDMGVRPPGTSLGRVGDAGNYEPGNCAWHTRLEHGAEQGKKCQMLLQQAA